MKKEVRLFRVGDIEKGNPVIGFDGKGNVIGGWEYLYTNNGRKKGWWIAIKLTVEDKSKARDSIDINIEMDKEMNRGMGEEELLDVIEDLVKQFAERRKDGKYYSYGLSSLEYAFITLIRYGRATGDSLVIDFMRRSKNG